LSEKNVESPFRFGGKKYRSEISGRHYSKSFNNKGDPGGNLKAIFTGKNRGNIIKSILLVIFSGICVFYSEGGKDLKETGGIKEIAKSEIDDFQDISLKLFRNELTRSLIVDYYSKITKSKRVAEAIILSADKYDIPVSLAFSLSWAESRYLPRAVNYNSNSVDRGLFQLNSLSFPNLDNSIYFDPYKNANLGLRHLKFCLNKGKNELVGLAIYNAGVSRVVNGHIPFSTLNHVSRILEYKRKLDARLRTEMKKVIPVVSLAELFFNRNRT